MTLLLDEEIEKAMTRGRLIAETELRVLSAGYDRRLRKIKLKLSNESEFIFPPKLVAGLANVPENDLSHIEILGIGFGISWPHLDIDLSLQGLLQGVFGSRQWMAKQAGMVKSEKKAAASRENGRKGGRPPR
jgi:hypothetical protein